VYASIRRYRLHTGSMEDLMERVDTGFADEISRQPGFCSYEAIDCGDGEVTTISVFRDGAEAEASRDLAQRWTEESLADFEFDRLHPAAGEIMVSRAAGGMLEPGHTDTSKAFASLRRYMFRRGTVDELMHIVDERFADEVFDLPGFLGYHALDCGGGELVSISLFADLEQCEASDELALRFVSEELRDFDIERTEVIGGTVRASRAQVELLEPAHA
jgi:hypothetical protein